MSTHSVVDYLGNHRGHSCGYCGGQASSISHGMWGYNITAQNYQDLINRGWRRSGRYCYKPHLKTTCCASYAIRCEALNFLMSKSQKKVVKSMTTYLVNDKRRHHAAYNDISEQVSDAHHIPECSKAMDVDCESNVCHNSDNFTDTAESKMENSLQISEEIGQTDSVVSEKSECNKVQGSSSYDPSRAPTRKAKDIRRERRRNKLLAAGMSPEDIARSSASKSQQKSLEDILYQTMPPDTIHKFDLRLVACLKGCPDFDQTFKESYSIYKKYQMAIHNDTPDECTEEQYTRFLVNTPFCQEDSSAPLPYTTFHQHYVLDGKIIAVGVLDVLPYCISSVYFYYDPDYSFLSLGRYSALTEIALTRKYNKNFPELKFYYMGFYIHTCPKMAYKGSYNPSYLLCPETYIFQPIEKCRPKLDKSNYHRLEEDPEKEDVDGAVVSDDVKVFYQRGLMYYKNYREIVGDSSHLHRLQEYASLVGKKCCCKNRMFLYLS